MHSGIYTITNLIDGKMYVGHTSDFKGRKLYHLNKLINNNHPNTHLQKAYNKYGKGNFEFEVLEEYPNEGFILSSMEHYWCNLLNTHNKKYGYNIKPTNPYGKCGQSEETKAKISKGNKGVKRKKPNGVSKETREKQSKAALGRTMSEEAKIKRTETRRIRREQGLYKTKYDRVTPIEQVRHNLSKSHKGIKIKEETVIKILESRKGYKHSEETKLKIGKGNSGKIKSPEECLRISNLHKGKKISQEEINKRIETRKLNGWNKKQRNN